MRGEETLQEEKKKIDYPQIPLSYLLLKRFSFPEQSLLPCFKT